jgi:hypothetical protein
MQDQHQAKKNKTKKNKNKKTPASPGVYLPPRLVGVDGHGRCNMPCKFKFTIHRHAPMPTALRGVFQTPLEVEVEVEGPVLLGLGFAFVNSESISREISQASASTVRAHFDCIFKATADCATGVWCVFYVCILCDLHKEKSQTESRIFQFAASLIRFLPWPCWP